MSVRLAGQFVCAPETEGTMPPKSQPGTVVLAFTTYMAYVGSVKRVHDDDMTLDFWVDICNSGVQDICGLNALSRNVLLQTALLRGGAQFVIHRGWPSPWTNCQWVGCDLPEMTSTRMLCMRMSPYPEWFSSIVQEFQAEALCQQWEIVA